MWWSVCVVCVAVACAAAKASIEFKEAYIWPRLDFAWHDDGSKAHALSNQQFQPENNALSGIRVWRDRLYLTLPRWRPGVPATLVSVATPAARQEVSPKLEPFPSWEMQTVGNCSALQFVQGLEIDTNGQMWVLDGGTVDVLATSNNRCPPKLVLIDLNSLADAPNATAMILHTLLFPEAVLSRHNDSLLVNLVLDLDDVLYISDASETDPGIIVFDARSGQAWKLRDSSSMRGDSHLNGMRSGRRFHFMANINALALTPVPLGNNKNRTLYYCPLASFNLYSISTSVLRDQASATRNDLSHLITNVGNKTSITQAMILDSQQVLYFGLNSIDSIARWDTRKLPLEDNIHVISKDEERLQWPSSFAFDTSGWLWVVSNRLHNFVDGHINLGETNYRVMRATTNTKSYLYPDASVPGVSVPGVSQAPMHTAHGHTTSAAHAATSTCSLLTAITALIVILA